MGNRVIISGFSQVDTRAGVIAGDFSPSSLGAGSDTSGNSRDHRRVDLFARLALSAAGKAMDDSDARLERLDLSRCGVIIGSALGGLHAAQQQLRRLGASGPARVSPFFIPGLMVNAASGSIAALWNFSGPAPGVAGSGLSLFDALTTGAGLIQNGLADFVLCGSADASCLQTGHATVFVLQAFATLADTQSPHAELVAWSQAVDAHGAEQACLVAAEFDSPGFHRCDSIADLYEPDAVVHETQEIATQFLRAVQILSGRTRSQYAGATLGPELNGHHGTEPVTALLTLASDRRAVSLALKEIS